MSQQSPNDPRTLNTHVVLPVQFFEALPVVVVVRAQVVVKLADLPSDQTKKSNKRNLSTQTQAKPWCIACRTLRTKTRASFRLALDVATLAALPRSATFPVARA
jgi:hypothetical protein